MKTKLIPFLLIFLGIISPATLSSGNGTSQLDPNACKHQQANESQPVKVETWHRRSLNPENKLVPCDHQLDDKAFVLSIIRNLNSRKGIGSLFLNLKRASEVSKLNLSSLNYDSAKSLKSERLGEALFSFKKIKLLNLSRNNLGNLNKTCVENLFKYFEELTELEELNLDGNEIDKMSEEAFDELLTRVTSKRKYLILYLENNHIYDSSITNCLNKSEKATSKMLISILKRSGFREETKSARKKFIFQSQ